MRLKLSLSSEKLKYNDQKQFKGWVNTNDKTTYIQAITSEIRKANLWGEKKVSDSKAIWELFIKYVNENKFYLYDSPLALEKRSKSYDNYLKEGQRKGKIRNIAFILHSKQTDTNIKYNTIVLFTDYEDGLPINVVLRRIQFFNMHLEPLNSDPEYVEIVNDSDDVKITAKDESKLAYETIFDDTDYKEDKIKFKEWYKLIGAISDILNVGNNEPEVDNFIINYNDEKYLVCRKSFSTTTKYSLNDYFNNQIIEIDKQSSIIWKFDSTNNEFLLELAKTKEDKKNQINDWKVANKNYENDNEQYEKTLTDLENELWILQPKKDDLEAKINNLDTQIHNNEIKVQEINKKIESEKKKSEKIQEIKVLENELDNIKKTNKDTEISMKQQKEELEKIRNEINEINSEIQQTNNNIKTNKEGINENQLKIKENENFIKNLDDFLNTINKEKFNTVHKFNQNTSFEDIEIPTLNFQDKDFSVNKLIKSFSLIQEDSGTKAIIKRFRIAIEDVENGNYKNPFFYKGIKKSDDKFNQINFQNKVPNDILQKYKLNEKQESAVEKAINTNSMFYLQGPPGTGKTQTISAITEWIIKQNLNIIMTSSTHEAINNFFDRLADNNKTNPNLIAVKYRFNKNSEKEKLADEQYSDKKLFRVFKDRMLANVIGAQATSNNDELSEFNQKLKAYQNSYGNQIPGKFNDWIPKCLSEYLFNLLKIDPKSNFINQFKTLDDDEELKPPLGLEKTITYGIQAQYEKWINKFTPEEKAYNEILELFLKVANDIEIQSIQFYQPNVLNQMLACFEQSQDDNALAKKLNIIYKKYNNLEDKNESKFLDYIVENKLINVIGLTTTSRNQISIGKHELDLFDNYDIDYIIIDEISKCSTPEIFSKATLAKKIIFAGDYLQLPPVSNISTDYVIKQLAESDFHREILEADNAKKNYDDKAWKDKNYSELEDKDKEKVEKLIQNYIDDLYKTSFFNILINTIKENKINSKNKQYEFLNESHRFGKEIMKIVNHVYDEEEQLKSPNNNFKQVDYHLEMNGSSLSNPAVLVNLVEIQQKFRDEHQDVPEKLTTSFDQKGLKCFKYKKAPITINGDSAYNQFSAWKISYIIKNLIELNQETFDKQKSKIGVIALTATQKNLIREYAKAIVPKEWWKYYKIDTIDNFQGREEDVIIVDFLRGEKIVENCKIQTAKERNISFLAQKERINVAVSRPKQKLILVGWFNYLKGLDKVDNYKHYYKTLSDSDNSYVEVKEGDE